MTDLCVKSVFHQYEDGKYSDFVEASVNAPHYKEHYHHSFMLKLDPLFQNIKSSRILDLACGNGILGRKIRRIRRDFEVVGVDQSNAMISKAKELCEYEGFNDEKSNFIECDVLNFHDDIGLFDCVTSGFFFAHIPTKEALAAVFVTIHDHLVEGGLTIHIIPGTADDEAPEGTPVRIQLPLDTTTKEISHEMGGANGEGDGCESGVEHHDIELFDYYWTPETYIQSSLAAGLVDVTFEKGVISQDGIDMNLPVIIEVYILTAKKLSSK